MKRLILAAAMLAAVVSPAFAHAHLLSETPADKATVTPGPTELVLTFSEGLVIKFTGVTITGPGGAVAVASSALDPKNDMVLDVTVAAALPAGAYTVAWHALSTDGHKTTGTYGFTVKA